MYRTLTEGDSGSLLVIVLGQGKIRASLALNLKLSLVSYMRGEIKTITCEVLQQRTARLMFEKCIIFI